MTEEQHNTQPEIKVTRKRKRLYQPIVVEQTASEDVSQMPAVPAHAALKSEGSRETEAHYIIMDYAMWSAGSGLFPVPVIDMVAITAIELKMLKKLSDLYDVSFSANRGKSLLASLLGGVHAALWAGSLLKMIPVFGMTGVIVSMPVIAGAITYAVGKVFARHFETGGTLLDFHSSNMKALLTEKYKEGHEIVLNRKRSGE